MISNHTQTWTIEHICKKHFRTHNNSDQNPNHNPSSLFFEYLIKLLFVVLYSILCDEFLVVLVLHIALIHIKQN